jgi:transposase
MPSRSTFAVNPEHQLAARHGRSKPVIDALRIWFEAQLPLVPGHSTLAEAIRYTLSRWNGLTRFLHDGRIELDTDPVERAIRPIALKKKSSLRGERRPRQLLGRAVFAD